MSNILKTNKLNSYPAISHCMSPYPLLLSITSPPPTSPLSPYCQPTFSKVDESEANCGASGRRGLYRRRGGPAARRQEAAGGESQELASAASISGHILHRGHSRGRHSGHPHTLYPLYAPETRKNNWWIYCMTYDDYYAINFCF